MTEHPRAIRSFVTRSGRITEAQERALEQLWPRYGVEFIPQPLAAQTLFGRDAPRTLAITSASRCTAPAWAGCCSPSRRAR
jgi:tRNA G46 methylase TrmB